jgi:protein TonB
VAQKAEPGKAYRVGGDVTPPKVVWRIDPEPSPEARGKHITRAVVLLRRVIETDGTVSNIQVYKAAGYGLDERAIESVRQWRFKPARKNGVPVRVLVGTEVNFKITD